MKMVFKASKTPFFLNILDEKMKKKNTLQLQLEAVQTIL
jgi:hypothetical protein